MITLRNRKVIVSLGNGYVRGFVIIYAYRVGNSLYVPYIYVSIISVFIMEEKNEYSITGNKCREILRK